MRSFTRTTRAALVAALAVTTLATPVFGAASQAAASAKPGLVGGRVVLANNASFSGYDVGTDGAGNTYIGWIGDRANDPSANRRVFLCTLPPGSSACKHGIQSIASLGISEAADLRLLVTKAGLVTLLWYTLASPQAFNGRDGRIAEATSQSGGPLSAAALVATGPSYAQLMDAEIGPGGAIWTVSAIGAGTSSMEVREGLSSPPVTIHMPYAPGTAQLAFAGSKPVIAAQKDGAVTSPVGYTSGVGTGFAPWKTNTKTWTAGANIGLVATKSGVRLIASVDNADYWPVIEKWAGSGFGKPAPTGDKNACSPFSHDLNTDASGRLVDVSEECSKITVANLPATTVAGLFSFNNGGTFAGGIPQIASTPRGHAVVVWSIESSVGDRLYFQRLLLPGVHSSVSKLTAAGRSTLTGPTSCQPASSITVGVKGGGAKGWSVVGASMGFGGKKLAASATIDGSLLTPNKVYTLTGRVVFGKGSARSVATEALAFRSCIKP
jgi:hypothetical protein